MHQRPQRSRSRLLTGLAVGLLIALAVPFRVFLHSSGAPEHAFCRNDEMHYFPRVMGFLSGEWGDFNFINPTFSLHLMHAGTVVWGWLLVLVGRFDSFADFSAEASENPYFITMVGRTLSVGASVAGVVVLFLVGRRLFAVPVALLAAAALAIDTTHVMRAPLAGNESLMVLFVLLFFLAVLRYVEAPSAGRHAAAGVLLGLAAATKYNAGIHVVTLAVATLEGLRRSPGAGSLARELGRPRVWVGIAAAPLAFAAASPFAILRFSEFLAEFGSQVTDFLGEGMAGISEARNGWTFYVTDFPVSNNGLPFALFCGLGILGAIYRSIRFRDTRCMLLLAAALPCYLSLASGLFHQMRFLFPSIPFLLLLGAWAFVGVVGRILARLVPGSEEGARSGLRAAAVLALGALTLAPAAERSHRAARGMFGGTDGRGELVVWLRENLVPGETYVTLVHPERLSVPSLQVYYGAWTPPEREDVDLVPLTDLVRESTTLEELRSRIKRHGRLLVVIDTYSAVFQRVGSVDDMIAGVLQYLPPIREAAYAPELGRYLAGLERETAIEREARRSGGLMIVCLANAAGD